jgi:putative ATP-dependent endonuclease of OLD family
MIEAALAVGNGAILKTDKFPLPPLRGWHDGKLADLPDENGADAVLVCRLTGTADQEAIFEVVGAGEEATAPFPRALRQ